MRATLGILSLTISGLLIACGGGDTQPDENMELYTIPSISIPTVETKKEEGGKCNPAMFCDEKCVAAAKAQGQASDFCCYKQECAEETLPQPKCTSVCDEKCAAKAKAQGQAYDYCCKQQCAEETLPQPKCTSVCDEKCVAAAKAKGQASDFCCYKKCAEETLPGKGKIVEKK